MSAVSGRVDHLDADTGAFAEGHFTDGDLRGSAGRPGQVVSLGDAGEQVADAGFGDGVARALHGACVARVH